MKEDKVSSVCSVCGDKATGIHYRVQSCEGCKGFWRRTIQRNMGGRYTCKLWTEKCPVTPETRGRCQRCRYLACVKAGMVADLVMADKERLSRLRLVDQNREKRRQEKGLTGGLEKAEQDGKLVELLHTMYGQFLLPTINQDPAMVARAAVTFVESLLFQLMGQRDVRDVVVVAHTEIAALHLVTTRPPLELLSVPLLSELAVQVSSLSLAPTEVVLCMAMAATRPRLTWPAGCRQELGMLWELVAGTVRRCLDNTRMAALLQLVQQVQAVTFYLGPLGLFNSSPALHYSPPTSTPSPLPLHYPPPHHPHHPPHPSHHQPHQPPQHPPTQPLPQPLPHHPTPALPGQQWQSPTQWDSPAPLLPPSPYHYMIPPVHPSPPQQPLLQTPVIKTEKVEVETPFYSPPPEQGPEEAVSPTSIPPKKRKLNLYSEILQEAINSTLT